MIYFVGYEQQNGDNNQWLNADGTEVTFTDWQPSEPNTAENACVITHFANRHWYDFPCETIHSLGYACRFETTKTADEEVS